MTTLEFRRLRQVELAFWLRWKFGKSWRQKAADEIGIPVIRTYRWFGDDICGRAHQQIERYAYANGFQSIYDEGLSAYSHHALILEDVVSKAVARHTAEGRKAMLKGAALPINETELDQLIAGLNYKLVAQR